MILQLRTPALESVALNALKGKDFNFDRDAIVNKKFSSYINSPLKGNGKEKRSEAGSAIEGFLSFAKENGFQEVKP